MASSTIEESVMVTLRPWATKEDAPSLPKLVERIANERDGLKNVTEKVLEEEIARERLGINPNEQDDTAEEKPKDIQAQLKQLFASKGELVQFVDQARNQAAMMLDLLSLQLRDAIPKAALPTLSPFIKESFPEGSLGLDKLQPPKEDAEDVKTAELVCTGWNFESLTRNADTLLSSAKKLNAEVEKETRYWQELSEVKGKGWNICRIPRRRNLVGVKFGFSEAGPLFQSQGLAALRADEQGNVILDEGITRQRKSLCVRIEVNGSTTAVSYTSPTTSQDANIEAVVRQASDTLFEDELFHEMATEARDLLAYDVEVIDNTIRLPLPDSSSTNYRYLLLSLEAPQSQAFTRKVRSRECEAIALACRLLLTNTYHERFKKRLKPPPPLSSSKESTSTSQILRPLMSFVMHRHASMSLTSFFQTLEAICKSAGYDPSLQVHAGALSGHQTESHTEGLVAGFIEIHRTSHQLRLRFVEGQNDDQAIEVETTTALSDPYYGNTFSIRGAVPVQGLMPEKIQVPNLQSVFTHVKQRICLSIASHIANTTEQWFQPDPLLPELHKSSASLGEQESTEDEKHISMVIKGPELALLTETPDQETILHGVWSHKESVSTLEQTIQAI